MSQWTELIPQTYRIIGYLVTCGLLFLIAFIYTPVRSFHLLVKVRRIGVILSIIFSMIFGGVLGYFAVPTSWSLVLRILVILFTAYAFSIWATQVLIVISQAAFSLSEMDLIGLANSHKGTALQLAERGERSKFLEYMESCIVLFRSHGYERAVIANHIVIARVLRELPGFDGMQHVSAAVIMSEGTDHKDLWSDALSLALEYISDQDVKVANKAQVEFLDALREVPELDYIRADVANELFVSYYDNGDFKRAADMAEEIAGILDNGLKGTFSTQVQTQRTLKNIVQSSQFYLSVLGQERREDAEDKLINWMGRHLDD